MLYQNIDCISCNWPPFFMSIRYYVVTTIESTQLMIDKTSRSDALAVPVSNNHYI